MKELKENHAKADQSTTQYNQFTQENIQYTHTLPYNMTSTKENSLCRKIILIFTHKHITPSSLPIHTQRRKT